MGQKALSAGSRLTESLLDGAFPKGIIYQANRDTDRAIAATNTAYMRMDGVALEAGRQYMVMAQQIHPTITGGAGTGVDRFIFSLRYNDTGVATTTNGSEIGRIEWSLQPVMNTDTAPPIIGWIKPGAAVTLGSIALCGWRTSGSGASPTLKADAGGIWINVIDMGTVVFDMGTDL